MIDTDLNSKRIQLDTPAEDLDLNLQVQDIARVNLLHIDHGTNSRKEEFDIYLDRLSEGRVRYIFYPQQDYRELYREMHQYSKGEGPGSFYPGSVGMLEVSLDSHDAHVLVLQSSINFTNLPDTDNGNDLRALGRNYGGWGFRLFCALLDDLAKSDHSKLYLGLGRGGDTVRDYMTSLAEKYGWTAIAGRSIWSKEEQVIQN